MTRSNQADIVADMLQTETVSSSSVVLPDLASFIIQQNGVGQSVSLEEFISYNVEGDECALMWLHMRGDHPQTCDTLERVGLDRFVIEALTAEETRPRCTIHEAGVVLNLRGANVNPNAEPEDTF